LFVGAMHEVTDRVLDRSCEQLVARVRVEHPRAAAELRAVLGAARRSCDISAVIDSTGDVAARSKTPAPSIDLNETVGL
jgi:hypothetical protein